MNFATPKASTLSTMLLLGLLLPPATACAEQEAPAPQAAAQEAAAPAAAPITPATDEQAAADLESLFAGAPSGAAPPPAAFDPATMPAVVARVDGAEISRAYLIGRADDTRAQMVQRGGPFSAGSLEFYREVLKQVVAEQLLFAEATRKGIAATDEEIGSQVSSIRGQFASEEQFTTALAGSGLTPADLEKEVRKNLVLQKLVENEIVPKVTVTDEAERAFYQQNLDQMAVPEQVRVSHILVNIPTGDEAKETARKSAQALLERVRAGEDFAELAKANSDDKGSAEKGGELPWIGPGRTVPAFEQAAFALQPGQVSDLVETQFGFHIIKMNERKPASTLSFEEVHERIGEVLTQQGIQSAVEARVNDLRAAAKIEMFL